MAPGLCSACALSSIPKGAGSSSGPKSTATASLLLSPPKQILIHQLDALLVRPPAQAVAGVPALTGAVPGAADGAGWRPWLSSLKGGAAWQVCNVLPREACGR